MPGTAQGLEMEEEAASEEVQEGVPGLQGAPGATRQAAGDTELPFCSIGGSWPVVMEICVLS